jgi:hypothetical protein
MNYLILSLPDLTVDMVHQGALIMRVLLLILDRPESAFEGGAAVLL